MIMESEILNWKGQNNTIIILLVEDNPGDARLFELVISEISNIQCDITWAKTLSEAFLQLQDNQIDIIFSDLTLPDSEGMDTLRSFVEKFSEVPVIVLSGFEDEERIKEALHIGALAYVNKGDVEAGLIEELIDSALKRKSLK